MPAQDTSEDTVSPVLRPPPRVGPCRGGLPALSTRGRRTGRLAGVDSHDLAFGTLIVNGVDVLPLVEAELDRRFPGRELQRAQTAEGLRDGWVAVQSAWQETVAGTPPELVDAHDKDEWSLALRHLVLVTDFLATVTPELLAEERDNPWGGDEWHPSVGDCLRVILEEEWAHLRYLRRDLALTG